MRSVEIIFLQTKIMKQVQILFRSALLDHTSTAPLLVPANMAPIALSDLLCAVLKVDATLYDFSIEDNYIRTSIEEHAAQYGITLEKLVIINYVPRTSPPVHNKKLTHDSWISNVRARWGCVLISDFNGQLCVWNDDEKQIKRCHTEKISALALGDSRGRKIALTGSTDKNIKIWEVI